MVPLCSYFEGMFSNQKSDLEDNPFYAHDMMGAAAHHEAAHAVVGYALGEPVTSVGIFADYLNSEGIWTVGYGGEVRHGDPGRRRHIDYAYRPLHFRIGVGAASGPAGERRYCLERGLPLRLLLATENDHDCITTIAKCLERRGRSRFAYQRLVWHAAQVLVNRDDIWGAICDVAEILYVEAALSEPEHPIEGQIWTFMERREVAAACRRHGIRRGCLRHS